MATETDTASEAEAPKEEYKAREYTKVPGSEKEAPASEKEAKSYTIKGGDTLSDIAQEQLGDANRWKEIYEMNKDVIGDDPDMIHPGKKLKLPD